VIRPVYETWTHLITMRSLWKIWVEAKSEEKALRVSERVRRTLGRDVVDQSIEPDPKTTGFLVAFAVELGSAAWNDCVVELIELGQRVGYGWILTGDILSDPSGWSNEPGVSGVKSIEWILMAESRPTTSEAAGI
jgi:hypothetical protein